MHSNIARGAQRLDRRRRHASDPCTPITVNIPVALLRQLDDKVVATRATRSGTIRLAVAAWLAQEEGKTGNGGR